MTEFGTPAREARLAAKFAAVGLVGFAIDALLLRLGFALHLRPAIARLISLGTAMQVTFAINGLYVFRCLKIDTCLKQWCSYMAANGFGNFFNYWIFVTLVSLHGLWVSKPWFALPASAFAAYIINYTGTRLLVFSRAAVAARGARRNTQAVQPGSTAV